MPILAALVAIMLIAAAVSVGQQIGHDAGFIIQLGAVPAIALVLGLGLWLYHRRRSHELIVARYHLKGDALGWRKVRLHTLEAVRVCAECGAIVPDYWTQEQHASWHEDLAALIAGRPLEPDTAVPWSAVTEHSVGAEPEPAELPEPAEPSAWRQVREVFRLRPREEPAEQLEPEPEPAQLEDADIGEYERKGRAFRAGMEQHLASERTLLLGEAGRRRDA